MTKTRFVVLFLLNYLQMKVLRNDLPDYEFSIDYGLFPSPW